MMRSEGCVNLSKVNTLNIPKDKHANLTENRTLTQCINYEAGCAERGVR